LGTVKKFFRQRWLSPPRKNWPVHLCLYNMHIATTFLTAVQCYCIISSAGIESQLQWPTSVSDVEWDAVWRSRHIQLITVVQHLQHVSLSSATHFTVKAVGLSINGVCSLVSGSR